MNASEQWPTRAQVRPRDWVVENTESGREVTTPSAHCAPADRRFPVSTGLVRAWVEKSS